MASRNKINLKWQKDSECSRPENTELRDFFFSTKAAEKYQAKNLCFLCPVRKECIQWALEHKQIWGVWGGKDEGEIRRTLSVAHNGQESRRERYPQCPYCNARPGKLKTSTVDVPEGGRWMTMRLVECTACTFSWHSRTSANAVDAYHLDRTEKLERLKKEQDKKEIKLALKLQRKKQLSIDV